MLIGVFCVPVSGNTTNVTINTEGWGVNSGGAIVANAAPIPMVVGQLFPENVPIPGSVPAQGTQVDGGTFAGYYTSRYGYGTRIYNHRGERVFHEPWDGSIRTLNAFFVGEGGSIVTRLHHENGTNDIEFMDWDLVGRRNPTIPESPHEHRQFAGYFTLQNGGEPDYLANVTGTLAAPSLELSPQITLPTLVGYSSSGYFMTSKHGHSYLLYDNTWTANEYTLTFDFMGDFDSVVNTTAAFNEIPESIAIPTRSGFDFGGYFTEGSALILLQQANHSFFRS
jgi:hypothetical protein